jgi:hypothetical protein
VSNRTVSPASVSGASATPVTIVHGSGPVAPAPVAPGAAVVAAMGALDADDDGTASALAAIAGPPAADRELVHDLAMDRVARGSRRLRDRFGPERVDE